MEHTLENDMLKICASDHGAELCHLINKATGAEYIWSGEAYWKRHSPVLFPFVGAVAGGRYRTGGKEYEMGQHGFARDMDFLSDGDSDGLWFHLDYSEETLQKYPYRFHLQIGYILERNAVKVVWRVTTEDGCMPFMIGAHPAFVCPPAGSKKGGACRRTGCFINFHTEDSPTYELLTDGLVGGGKEILSLTNGRMRLNPHSFDRDALIFEGDRLHELTLEDEGQQPFLTIRFNAPLFGIWSPAGDVPFVCLEPWYGRTDRVGFCGSLSERAYEQSVRKGELFERSYSIIIEA